MDKFFFSAHQPSYLPQSDSKFGLEVDLLDLRIRLEASFVTPSFCDVGLRSSMPLIVKFYFGQRVKNLPLDFLRDLSSRSIKLVVAWTFLFLLGTTVVIARMELQGLS